MASRKVEMVAAGSSLLKMAVPATMTFAPASAATSIVEGDRPPSTWMFKCGYFLRSVATCHVQVKHSISGNH